MVHRAAITTVCLSSEKTSLITDVCCYRYLSVLPRSDPAHSLLSRKLSQGDHGALGVAGAQPAADPLHLRERERHHHFCQRKSSGNKREKKDRIRLEFSDRTEHATRVFVHAVTGDHRRVQQKPRRQRGRRHGQVQGGQRQVQEVVWDAG